jgi:hypothetical protein
MYFSLKKLQDLLLSSFSFLTRPQILEEEDWRAAVPDGEAAEKGFLKSEHNLNPQSGGGGRG